MKDSVFNWLMGIAVVLICATYFYFNNQTVYRWFNDPPYVSLEGDKIIVEEFYWNFGVTETNILSGRFDLLDERVYNLLKGKSGKYQLVRRNQEEDKYGNPTVHTSVYGMIDADELNKYREGKWHGTADIIYPHKPNSELPDSLENYIFPDQLHVSEQRKQNYQRQRSTELPKVFQIRNVNAKQCLYYERRDGHFTNITPQEPDYQQFVDYWDRVKREIKDIQVEMLDQSVTVTIWKVDGESSKFELQSLLGKALYGMQGGENQLVFAILPGGLGCVQLIDGDKSLAIYTE